MNKIRIYYVYQTIKSLESRGGETTQRNCTTEQNNIYGVNFKNTCMAQRASSLLAAGL